MPIIPKLECRVETFREDDAVFMRIGIHQEEMLLAYYAFDNRFAAMQAFEYADLEYRPLTRLQISPQKEGACEA